MRAVARNFAEKWLRGRGNFTVFLDGGLGAGKSVFARECLRFFGIGGAISSPTFVFVNEYSAGGRDFAHFDCHRLADFSQFFEKGLGEVAEDSSVSSFVEWPEKCPVSEFSGAVFWVKISIEGAGRRRVSVFEGD